MIVSMTGFGRAHIESNNISVTAEIKSVNHRFCEIIVRMPRHLSIIEDKMKKVIGEYVHRGRIEAFLTIDGENFVKRSIHIDWTLMDSYFNSLKLTKDRYSLECDITLEQLFSLDDITTINEIETGNEEIHEVVLETLKKASNQLKLMRQREGKQLLADISSHLNDIKYCMSLISEIAPQVVSQYRDRISKRVKEFVTGVVDEDRLLAEVAIFAEKVDISEEIARINSHITQFIETIHNSNNRVVGRKLDFLVQEMNREINTIGSKANDSHIANQVVEVKSLLEKIKEQVQNIE
ncbi:YicC family protein [Cytobacillus sp. S13-E01]|uniref:YicC/YloC family endoribonuclease n=1 Tax=Cytobacillus sp. S13-E01 TaxID=3031326 RepID=UPI0023D7DC47|nr:YicC/YloC family endoribonuclease [Cytobacillus sp. S13-E01]MDF0725243.1 YicC family protein [Cytobacillus sp. S13-E01]